MLEPDSIVIAMLNNIFIGKVTSDITNDILIEINKEFEG